MSSFLNVHRFKIIISFNSLPKDCRYDIDYWTWHFILVCTKCTTFPRCKPNGQGSKDWKRTWCNQYNKWLSLWKFPINFLSVAMAFFQKRTWCCNIQAWSVYFYFFNFSSFKLIFGLFMYSMQYTHTCVSFRMVFTLFIHKYYNEPWNFWNNRTKKKH